MSITLFGLPNVPRFVDVNRNQHRFHWFGDDADLPEKGRLISIWKNESGSNLGRPKRLFLVERLAVHLGFIGKYGNHIVYRYVMAIDYTTHIGLAVFRSTGTGARHLYYWSNPVDFLAGVTWA